ncbi:MAG: hypothetical protein HC819_00310 [Cyclobacteriaceae bacterium]|nr:hypothetical protein [Cyclobacteriaceae bacterium]
MSILSTMELSWIDAKAMTLAGVAGAALVISGAIMVVISKKKKATSVTPPTAP